MKKLLALLLVLAMVFSMVACGGKPSNNDPTDPNGGNTDTPTDPVEVDDGICETAWEAAENMGLGWNLGCSLSVATKTTVSAFAGLIGMHTEDGLYSRSEYLNFNEETNSVTLEWDLGNDNGLLQTYEGALVGEIFVEQWNFALTEADYCTFTVEEFSYTLKSGETVSIDPVTAETDMSGGTGVIWLLDMEDLDGLLVEDIKSMHCVMSYGGMNASEPTPEKIATQETAWGNPVTTQEMIDAVAERGFKTIRVQVSYLNHMDAEGNIDELWLDRVQEVVDYCMNAGLYCVINTSGYMWMTCNPADWEVQKPVYTNLWKQISERFADYGEKLIFESCNEILYAEGLWNYPPMEAYDVMHEIHQTFVDTVRAGGGYNETRNLMLNPYAAGYDYEMNKNFTLPTDTVEGHLMAQVHCYVPQDFTFNETNLGSTNFRYEWGTEEDKQQLDDVLKGIKKRFIDELGIPVVIGEFGIAKRINEGEAAEYLGFYAKTADKYGIGLILFDDGVDIAVFDRGLLIWLRPQVVDALFNKDAPAHEGGENDNTITGVPEVPEVTDPMPGWYSRLYFTDSDGTYNTSVTAEYSNGTKKSKLLWVLGDNDTDFKAKGEANVMEIGMDLWNFTLNGKVPQEVEVLQLTYYTKNGAVNVPVSPSKMTIELNNGAGAVKLGDLSGVKVEDVVAIYLETKLVVEETGTSVSGLPYVSETSNPYGDYQAVVYFGTLQTGYNRSDPAAKFDADTKTVEVLYKLDESRANGFTTAGEDEILASLGVEVWNFGENRPAKISYSVLSLKYYTDSGSGMKVHSVPMDKSTYTVKFSPLGTAGAQVASLTNSHAVGDVVAIYAKIRLNITDEPEPEPETPAGLPEVTPTTNPSTTSSRLYLATKQTGYNTSDYSPFDAETKQSEILWMFNDGSVQAAPEELLAVLGVEIADFTNRPAKQKVRIDEIKYYTLGENNTAVAHDLPLTMPEWTYYLSGGQEGKQNCTYSDDTGPKIGDIIAVYMKATLVDDSDAPKPEGLPEIVPATDPVYTGTRLYLADPYTASPYTYASTSTGVGEVLWMLDDGSMAAYADKPLTDICLETTNYAETLTHLNVQIEELKYFVAVDGGYQAVTIPVNSNGQFVMDMAAMTCGAAIGKVAEEITIGEVAALYVKYKFVDEFESLLPVVQLPEIVPAADPVYTGTRLYLADPYTASAYTYASTSTGVGEVLWMLDDGSMAAHADKPLADICLETTNYAETLTHLNVQIEELKYYVAAKGGYNEFTIPVNSDGQFVMDMTTCSGYANLGKPAEEITIGEVAALYVKFKFVDAFAPVVPDAPVVQLPEIVPAADPVYTGTRLYLADPYTASAYTYASTSTGVGEVLWMLDDGSMAAYADKPLADIWLETTNYAETLTTLNVQVEELKYYVAVEGGYNEYTISVNNNGQFVQDMTTCSAYANLGKPAEEITIGEVAALYAKYKFVDEFTTKYVDKLPEVTTPGNLVPNYHVMPYFATVSAGFNRMDPTAQFDADTNTAKALFVLEDCRTAGFVTAKEDESILGIGMNFWNFTDVSASFSYTVKELKYYTAEGDGYMEHTIKLDTDTFALTLAGGAGANGILTLTEGELIVGDVVAIYAEIQLTLPAVETVAEPLPDANLVETPDVSLEPEEE